MTTVDTDHSIVGRVLGLRGHTSARSALRRGTSTTTEHYAYPYLAEAWADRPWLRVPLLRFASLAAATDLPHDSAVALGRHLRGIAEAAGRTDDRRSHVERKLVLVQTGDVDKFHQVVRTVVASGRSTAGGGLDWFATWDLYRRWDHPDAEVRTRVRRRLLEDFYAPVRASRADITTDTNDGDPTVAANA